MAGVGGTGGSTTTVYADGALVAPTAQADGNATRIRTGAGTLAAVPAGVVGSGYRTLEMAPTLSAQATTLTVAALKIITSEAIELAAVRADLDGDAIRIGDTQGQLEANPVSVSATVLFGRNASGTLEASPAAATNTSSITRRVTAVLGAQQAMSAIAPKVFRGHVAAGALQARETGVATTVDRTINASPALVAVPAGLYVVSWLDFSPVDGVWSDYSGGEWVPKD
jgi:hypothetical protein